MAGTHDLSRDPIPVPRKLTFVCTSEADAKPLPPGASRRVGREEDKAVFEVEVDMSGVATFGDGCKLALNEIVGIGNHDGVAVKPTRKTIASSSASEILREAASSAEGRKAMR